MKNEDKFVTAVTCMDGRIQTFVNDWMLKTFQVPFVDVITEPGPNGILAAYKDLRTIESIKRRLDVSVNKHGSEWIVLVGHEDCTGNPGPMEKQIRDVKEGLKTLEGMNFDANLMGIWVDLSGHVDIITERRCVAVG